MVWTCRCRRHVPGWGELFGGCCAARIAARLAMLLAHLVLFQPVQLLLLLLHDTVFVTFQLLLLCLRMQLFFLPSCSRHLFLLSCTLQLFLLSSRQQLLDVAPGCIESLLLLLLLLLLGVAPRCIESRLLLLLLLHVRVATAADIIIVIGSVAIAPCAADQAFVERHSAPPAKQPRQTAPPLTFFSSLRCWVRLAADVN